MKTAKDVIASMLAKFNGARSRLDLPESSEIIDALSAAGFVVVPREEAFPMTIKLAEREDGGLRAWSDDMPGLVLSHSERGKVLDDLPKVWAHIHRAMVEAS